MLQDLRGSYIRRNGDNRRGDLLIFLAIGLAALLISAALIFASLKFGAALNVENLDAFAM